MTESEDEPVLEELVTEYESKSWQPPPETQDQILEVLEGVIPTNMRPSDQMLEKYYDRGHQLYKAGRYKAALSYFKVLTSVKPTHPKYLMAAAACHHMMKEYSTAMDYYTLAAMIDEENPIPQYHLAGCMIKMEQPIGALVALTMGIERCSSSPRYNSLGDRMKMMVARLDKELKEKQAAGLPFIINPEQQV
ncbi:MAG: SycD/LcrH family type III secretion system chaperone [Parachlamydia sp.]|nr:SycD/LcrH family type III secretion system chaperone [Parachlamydia sp.]